MSLESKFKDEAWRYAEKLINRISASLDEIYENPKKNYTLCACYEITTHDVLRIAFFCLLENHQQDEKFTTEKLGIKRIATVNSKFFRLHFGSNMTPDVFFQQPSLENHLFLNWRFDLLLAQAIKKIHKIENLKR